MNFTTENFPQNWANDLEVQGFYPIPFAEDYCLNVCIDFDNDSSINDFDCYGTVEWSNSRPENFDGSSEIIERDRGSKLWWLPYREGRKIYNSSKDRLMVMDICNYGFRQLTLKLIGPSWDANKNKHRTVLSETSIGAIEPFGNYSELIKDLAVDVLEGFSC